MLRRVFATLAGRGIQDVTLSVDAQNGTGAPALYERAGMRVVNRFDQWERELRGTPVALSAPVQG
jgi:mycothiol synthase